MSDHGHPSYDPIRRQIEALIRECDELTTECQSRAARASAAEHRAREGFSCGYRQAIEEIAERTGCKTRPGVVSTLHELRDDLCIEIAFKVAGPAREPGDALTAAEEAYLRARGWIEGYGDHWLPPFGERSVPRHVALTEQRRRDRGAGNG